MDLIYKLFDNNIASEIRLQDVLKEDLLCPFHYFGISDLEVDGKTVDNNSDFSFLANEGRVDYIIKQAEYYGYDGDRVKGLIFCSRNEEAKKLYKIKISNIKGNHRMTCFYYGVD